MSISTASRQPLGIVLQRAGLVSARQVKIALEEQCQFGDRIGEILAAHGWLKQESADFFAEEWPGVQQHKTSLRLGQYLERAALLDTAQIDAILETQQRTQQKFGTLAIQSGQVKRRTINFFLKYLRLDPLGYQSGIASGPEMQKELLLENETVNPAALLLQYQRILRQGAIAVTDRPEQLELLEMGLIVAEQNRLRIADGLAPSLLSQQWVAQQLEKLKPYHWIWLKLFKLAEHSDHPFRTLTAILDWTHDQIDLTHKVGWLIRETDIFIAAGEEEAQVAELVQSQVIRNWQSGSAAEHLQKRCDLILGHQDCSSLLKLYQRILERQSVIAEDSPEERELLKLGLITKREKILNVANRIYQLVFSPQWVAQKLPTTAERTSAEETLSNPKIVPLRSRSELEVASDSSAQYATAQEVLSATTVVSDLLSGDLKSWSSPVTAFSSEMFPSRSEEGLIIEDAPSSRAVVSTTPKPRRILLGLVLCAGAGILTAIGMKTWRQPNQVMTSSTQQDSITSSTPPQPVVINSQVSLPSQGSVLPATQDRQPSTDQERDSSVNPATDLSAKDLETIDRDQRPTSISSSTVVSASNPTIKVPIFGLGSTLEQVTDTLGPPTWNRRGYYGNSRALLYEGIVPDQVDLGYLVSQTTGKLRQTETTFAQSVPLETMQRTLKQLLQGTTLPPSVQEQLQQIYQRQADQHTFKVGNLEGNIHWQPEGWIYIGIWDADFH